MKHFDYSKLKTFKWDSEILKYISHIYRELGKQDQFLRSNKNELNSLIDTALVNSVQSSNAIEGIVTTKTRLTKIVKNNSSPKNRSEEEIAGYRDVLKIINDNFDNIAISRNYILQLHQMLYSHSPNSMAGKIKNSQNYITGLDNKIIFTPLAPIKTVDALDNLCIEYNKVIGNNEIEPLIAIGKFIHDFLCIHPFNDGNGRMSRLLTNLLLYQNGFYVGMYISLESKIANNKDLYYQSLEQSQNGWHENKEDSTPFIKYLLSIILSAYKDLSCRFDILENSNSALETVKKAVDSIVGKFNKENISQLCPSLSTSSIEKSLKELVRQTKIKKHGTGRSTYYTRTIKK